MEKQSYWKEIRNNHITSGNDLNFSETLQGDIRAVCCIDAWKTDDDWEEGKVIARVAMTLRGDILVNYEDPKAQTDISAQEAIAEAKEKLRKHWLNNCEPGSKEKKQIVTRFGPQAQDGDYALVIYAPLRAAGTGLLAKVHNGKAYTGYNVAYPTSTPRYIHRLSVECVVPPEWVSEETRVKIEEDIRYSNRPKASRKKAAEK